MAHIVHMYDPIHSTRGHFLYVMEVGLKALRDSLVEFPPPPVNSILSRVEYTVLQSELRKRWFSLIAY